MLKSLSLGMMLEVLPSSETLFYIKVSLSGEFRVDNVTAAISFSKQNFNDFVSGSYKSYKLTQLYAIIVELILVSELDSQNVLQPIARRLPERPKKLELEKEMKVRKAISLALCVIKMAITKELV